MDGTVIAESVKVADDLKYQRTYPFGPLYAQITGFQSLLYGTTGIEHAYDGTLLGRNANFSFGATTQNVRLSIDSVAQLQAAASLRARRGSIVVLDVRTGGIVALYSNPTFDPNGIATHNDKLARDTYKALQSDPKNPMLARVTRERFPPGSTFKVVTTAIALDKGIVDANTSFPRLRKLQLPQSTGTLSNFGGVTCGGPLRESFRESCNTTFGQIGLTLGEDLAVGGERFGLNGAGPPLDGEPSAVGSVGPLPSTFKNNQPLFALDAIGQGDVATTPLEMALVAESVATGGTMLVPHFLSSVEDPNRPAIPVRTVSASPWRQVMQPTTAVTLNELMRLVVSSGTGTAAQISGVVVAGKTGTAQTREGRAPHAWFIGFAPADAPKYAIAVLVENVQDPNVEATGGKVAAPIARDVLRALFQARGVR